MSEGSSDLCLFRGCEQADGPKRDGSLGPWPWKSGISFHDWDEQGCEGPDMMVPREAGTWWVEDPECTQGLWLQSKLNINPCPCQLQTDSS